MPPRPIRHDPRDPESPVRRRRPDRIGDLIPEAAHALGLDAELRLARAIATWDAIVAEHVPPAAGICHLVRVDRETLVVTAEEPIVAAELRMRASELLAAFSAAPGGSRVRFLTLSGGDRGPDRGTERGPRRVPRL